LNTVSRILPGPKRAAPSKPPRETLRKLQRDLHTLLKSDASNIAQGLYPASVLKPEPLRESLLRIPLVLQDSAAIYRRRFLGKTQEFSREAKDFLDEVPRYYRRNFHFQTDGYLSDRSAELYEYQVEMLFSGAGNAMRRLIIAPMREALGTRDGRGMTFLEIGCGTGPATRMVRLAFPKARIVAVDLSDPYLRVARRRLAEFPRVDFLQADGGALPFQDGQFDAVYSVFLFHELPLEERKKVLAESRRVLRKGGFCGLVDSTQKGDRPYLDPLLENFPKDFHEPFYRNYSQNPMETLLSKAGFKQVGSDVGFLSKVCWAHKA
jgi:ubiquinone/menaquinone biosynthesis C-methylase UbiE